MGVVAGVMTGVTGVMTGGYTMSVKVVGTTGTILTQGVPMIGTGLGGIIRHFDTSLVSRALYTKEFVLS